MMPNCTLHSNQSETTHTGKWKLCDPAYPDSFCVTLDYRPNKRRHKVDVSLLARVTSHHQLRNIKGSIEAVEFPANKTVQDTISKLHNFQYI